LELSKWDKDFMKWGSLNQNVDSSEEKCKHITELGDNFFAAATTFSKMIVAEQHCSEREKKILPIDVGGVAGGTKFSIHGLFFKYPNDTCIDSVNERWLYGGYSQNDSTAAKASNHDLKGLTHCMIANENENFHFPLMALIDYEGFRMSVMTTLPINDETLVYGSRNAGKTMFKDEYVHENMLKIGKKLNLRPHLVSHNITEMALCGDVEIHNFKDDSQNVYYSLDLARVFPPACILDDSPQGSIFFRMLRPEILEIVGCHDIRLSSDALSGWQDVDPNAYEMNNDIKRATEILTEQTSNNQHSMGFP